VTHSVDVPYLLHAAEAIAGDPQVDDLGPLFAAAARTHAEAMGRDVYGSDHLKAAALLHTLARMPCLEHSNGTFAWMCGAGFLTLNGHTLTYPPKAAAALVRDAADGRIGVDRIARQLREWTTE